MERKIELKLILVPVADLDSEPSELPANMEDYQLVTLQRIIDNNSFYDEYGYIPSNVVLCGNETVSRDGAYLVINSN